ncbi:hypothetical protein [Oceanotoga teriensis]|jgi:hypothetical protein|uniref:hypothetical protein n=1 Tax=Oceanotoga teriensis TaxID=515440 RepID=UPI0027138A01|nr:hypothetical protein [Oceanotoga teriensis]MDO7977779.1 hypothetical protein [Oceanotoga teriensis]
MSYSLTEPQIKEIFKFWNINDLNINNKIIKIFENVRDIPYGNINSRSPYDVFKNNMGTCSGKHFLARDLFNYIGIKTKDMICLQRWKDLTWFENESYKIIEFAEPLKDFLYQYEIIDFHNYLMIMNNNRWIQVDLTLDSKLSSLGFKIQESWDGNSDIPMCFVTTNKIWECGNFGAEKKAELVSKLPDDISKNRKMFLKAFTKWLDDFRNNKL